MGIYEEIASNKRRSYLLIFFFMVFVIFVGFVVGFFYGSTYFGVGLALVIGIIYFQLVIMVVLTLF